MTDAATDRNVFILGAGFSREAGAPLLNDFLDRSREIYDDPVSNLDEYERSQFADVFRFKREVAKAREKFRIDLDNIEQLFGLVEMASRLGTTPPATRDATVYLIAKTLQLALASPSKRPPIRLTLNPVWSRQASWVNYLQRSLTAGDVYEADIYTHFALLISGKYDDPKKLANRSSAVITFNYDLVLDDALTRVGVQPDYQLAVARSEASMNGDLSVPLLKLHGSTNWTICGRCQQVHVLGKKATESPSTFRSMVCEKCRERGLRLLLVPPSWDKSEYSNVMQPVWKRAIEELRSATRICVIGYSMPETDAFFKFLLGLGLAENDRLYKLVVVDWVTAHLSSQEDAQPDIETIESRWKHMLESVFVTRRFRFHPEGAAAFIDRGFCYELQRGEQLG